MAGGKETPRQKMIGLMYLVLTALLALNVSKQILDAFVAIEENIQRGSITQYERGNSARATLKQELSDLDGTPDSAEKAKKIKKFLGMIEQIDKNVGEFIKYVDEIKLDIIGKVEGEDAVKTAKPNDKKSILWKKYDPNNPLLPTRLYLQAINQKENFDVPMHEIIGSEITKIDPTKKGKKLWSLYKGLRSSIVEVCANYQEGETVYKLKATDIDKFSNFDDLDKQIRKMFESGGNKVNPEDVSTLLSIYQELTKLEMDDHHETKNVHWLGRTFDHAPLVGALASLSSLQNEILAARAKAVFLLQSKVTTGEYSFNKIQELVSGPGVATQGEDIELLVTMAAYDSDKNPEVTSSSGNIEIKDGIAHVKLKAGASDMKINGKVTIKNKMGIPRTRDWEWKVAVAKPQGSIALPEMSVLYRGYDNKVAPVVAGAVSSNISASNASISARSFNVDGNNYNGYVVRPGGGTQTVLTLTGKDKDGKSKTYAVVKYKVKEFPDPSLGNDKISKRTGLRVSLILKGSALNVAFTPTGGYLSAGDEKVFFQGGVIPGTAVAKVKPGSIVGVVINCNGPGGTRSIKSALTVVP